MIPKMPFPPIEGFETPEQEVDLDVVAEASLEATEDLQERHRSDQDFAISTSYESDAVEMFRNAFADEMAEFQKLSEKIQRRHGKV